jgi:hypothetical protein
MKINMKKCKVMLFRKPRQHLTPINIELNGERIEQVETFKLLGFHMDVHLNWGVHLKVLRNRLRSQLFLLKSIKNFLPNKCLKQLYYGLFHSHLTYGCTMWVKGCYRSDLNYIKGLHKKALKLFPSEDVLDINSLAELELLKFGHKFKNNLLPESLNVFLDIAPNRGIDVRGRYNFHVHRFHLEVFRKSFINQIPVLWNAQHTDLLTRPFSSFVRALKRKLAS